MKMFLPVTIGLIFFVSGCAESDLKVSQSTLKVCGDLKYIPTGGVPILVSNSSEWINEDVKWRSLFAFREQPGMTPNELVETAKRFRISAIPYFNVFIKSVARNQYQIVEKGEMALLLEEIYDFPSETRTDKETYEFNAPIYNKILDICKLSADTK
jgi:hypothetical protein